MISHFYHVYANGLWQDPVREHLDALISSELYDNLDNVFVGFVGSEENVDKAKEYLSSRINYTAVAQQEEGWEQVTMKHVRFHAHAYDGITFYAHTKGAHDPSRINIEWRKSMTYFNVIRWRDAVHHLKTFDTVGTHWCNNAFWGGTYWWANNFYLRRLPDVCNEDRWDAEEWIGLADLKMVYDMNPGWPAFERFVTQW